MPKEIVLMPPRGRNSRPTDVSDAEFLKALEGLLAVYPGRTDDCIRMSPEHLRRLVDMARDR